MEGPASSSWELHIPQFADPTDSGGLGLWERICSLGSRATQTADPRSAGRHAGAPVGHPAPRAKHALHASRLRSAQAAHTRRTPAKAPGPGPSLPRSRGSRPWLAFVYPSIIIGQWRRTGPSAAGHGGWGGPSACSHRRPTPWNSQIRLGVMAKGAFARGRQPVAKEGGTQSGATRDSPPRPARPNPSRLEMCQGGFRIPRRQ